MREKPYSRSNNNLLHAIDCENDGHARGVAHTCEPTDQWEQHPIYFIYLFAPGCHHTCVHHEKCPWSWRPQIAQRKMKRLARVIIAGI